MTTGGAPSAGGMTSSGGGAGTGAGGQGAVGGNVANGGMAGTTGGTMGGTPSTGGMPPAGGAGAGGAAAGDGGTAGVAGMGTAGAAAGSAGASACPTVSDFGTWPSGKAPTDIGALAANEFKSHTGADYGGDGYALGFSWYGALQFTKITGDTASNMGLITAFEPYLTGSKASKASPNNAANSATVDDRAFGVLPLEIYLENGDTRAFDLGMARADTQWTDAVGGVPRNVRHWADDMYMITALQVMAYRAATKKGQSDASKYLDRAASTMLDYFTTLQQSDGLFWHTQQSHAYWGRANGWVAAGMSELLLELPAGTVRDQVMAGYKKQMDGILPLQISGGEDDGLWRQVLDLSSAPDETSCSAMFTFALTTGAKNGWLTDPKYAAAAKKGWLGVTAKVNTAGKLADVCPGTGQADAGSISSQQQYYVDRMNSTTVGDLHGQAPLLWSAYALLRTDCPGVR
jgi:rhamnogalacturonyl hydrolase YesR